MPRKYKRYSRWSGVRQQSDKDKVVRNSFLIRSKGSLCHAWLLPSSDPSSDSCVRVLVPVSDNVTEKQGNTYTILFYWFLHKSNLKAQQLQNLYTQVHSILPLVPAYDTWEITATKPCTSNIEELMQLISAIDTEPRLNSSKKPSTLTSKTGSWK